MNRHFSPSINVMKEIVSLELHQGTPSSTRVTVFRVSPEDRIYTKDTRKMRVMQTLDEIEVGLVFKEASHRHRF